MPDPRTTVIIPVYNGEAYIREAIKSVSAQTVPCLELIIVDDGSTDDTLFSLGYIVQKDGLHVPVEMLEGVLLITYPINQGAAHALNVGIQAAETEFVCWLSHDDVFYPEKIALQEAFMDLNPEASACYTDFDIVDGAGTHIREVVLEPPVDGGMFRQVCVRNIINGSSIMIRRKVFDEVGLFREDLPVDVDGEMWLRMLAAGHRFVHLPEVLLKYRRHGGQLSSNRALMLKTKDAVRAEWIEKAPFVVVFHTIGDYRDGLARLLEKQRLTQAAEAARRKTKEVL